MSNERFIELSKDNPSEIEKKLFIKPTDQNWPDLSVDLFINQIQNVVADNPQIGFILWELVNQHKENFSKNGTNDELYCITDLE